MNPKFKTQKVLQASKGFALQLSDSVNSCLESTRGGVPLSVTQTDPHQTCLSLQKNNGKMKSL